MKNHRIGSNALRLTFLVTGCIISTGIWLTGIDMVHWLLFVPAGFLLFAGIFGICPGLIISRLLLREG